ncbi:MAG TPA: sugar phosphate isomerase/epimerase family protein, partial [Opitutaceae bacterium]|nr:sugar phosphate isomerase/epimerase family protein [Opitutaceae bacterium]
PMSSLNRRDFLKISTAAGLAAATAPFGAFAAAPKQPFGRTGKPRLLLSLAAYSFRDNFPTMRGKQNTKMPAGKGTDMFKFIDYCAAQGCDGAELTSYFFAEETDEYMIKLRRHAFLRGVAVSGTAIGNNFSLPKGAKLDEEIATTKKWIDRALLMGAPHIRVFAGNVPRDAKNFTRDDADKNVITALIECCEYAGKRGIFLGLENHDSIGSAEKLIPMIKAINSPWIGINLDSGNFHTADPYKDFAECVPYAVNVQLKAEVEDGKGGKAPADFKRYTKILRDAGYQGWVALEYESKEDAAVAVPRTLQELRSLFQA